MSNADCIHIRDLALRCIIGLNDNERTEQQDVLINLTLYCDLSPAGKSDELHDSIDYKILKKKVIALVEKSSFFLLERLAEAIAAECLSHEKVKEVTVCVDKPGALRFARSVAVEITRNKNISKSRRTGDSGQD